MLSATHSFCRGGCKILLCVSYPLAHRREDCEGCGSRGGIRRPTALALASLCFPASRARGIRVTHLRRHVLGDGVLHDDFREGVDSFPIVIPSLHTWEQRK